MLQRIRRDSEFVFRNASHVQLHQDVIERVVKGLTSEELERWSHSTVQDTCDLDFSVGPAVESHPEMNSTTRRHINFLSLIDLINFASGFR